MAKFQNPGAFFLGTLVPAEQKFLKPLIENARKQGYTKFVEPCSGAFAMSHLAVQSGFKPTEIEASDVSMFTSIMGYAIMEKSLEELELKAEGFTSEELLDPPVALYAWKVLSTTRNAGKDYFYNMLLDLQYRREEHIETLREQLDRAKGLLKGFSYRPLDMWKHMDEVLDDPHCLVIANPPTYTAGFEKWYDTGGKMSWKEPEYGIFDPKTGLKQFMDLCKDAKCLVMCYEENEPHMTAGTPVFARYGVRNGINVYLTTNRPDEATALAEGKKITRPSESKLEKLECSMLPRDYEITDKSKVELCQVERAEAQYYRQLWTHNFVGSSAPINIAVLIDGKIAGVFGVDKSALTMGAFGTQVSDALFLMYGMTVPHVKYRLGRLLTMLAQNREFVYKICTDLEKEKVNSLKTVQMTKYPEAKEMRGIMKLTKKVPDKKMGFRLTYESELKDRTQQGTLSEWLRREEKWRKEREAGMKEVIVILDISGLNRSQIAAKQIAHNAISGFDDNDVLKEIAKMISDVDDMLESYIGKDILEEPMAEIEKLLSPTVSFDWKNVVFAFLPHQINDLEKLVKAIETQKPEFIGAANVEQYKEFMETLSKFQGFSNIKNVGAAIHAMIKQTKSMLEDVGYSEDREWVQLTEVFGGSAIPKESADVIKEAVKKMMNEGTIGAKNKWQFIEYLAADYLAGK